MPSVPKMFWESPCPRGTPPGGSVDDSAELARNLGIEFWEIPIEPAHTAFTGMLAERFAGTEPNVAEENVQARIRGNVLMTVSNKFGWIVLTTGNKSEMAMGYATLYGDMAGGFAVLKDVHKVTVYALARWRNENGHLIDIFSPSSDEGEGQCVPGKDLSSPAPSSTSRPAPNCARASWMRTACRPTRFWTR